MFEAERRPKKWRIFGVAQYFWCKDDPYISMQNLYYTVTKFRDNFRPTLRGGPPPSSDSLWKVREVRLSSVHCRWLAGLSRLLDPVSGTLCRRTQQHRSSHCRPSVNTLKPTGSSENRTQNLHSY